MFWCSLDEDARIAQQLYMEEMERQREEEKQRLLREQQDAVSVDGTVHMCAV